MKKDYTVLLIQLDGNLASFECKERKNGAPGSLSFIELSFI